MPKSEMFSLTQPVCVSFWVTSILPSLPFLAFFTCCTSVRHDAPLSVLLFHISAMVPSPDRLVSVSRLLLRVIPAREAYPSAGLRDWRYLADVISPLLIPRASIPTHIQTKSRILVIQIGYWKAVNAFWRIQFGLSPPLPIRDCYVYGAVSLFENWQSPTCYIIKQSIQDPWAINNDLERRYHFILHFSALLSIHLFPFSLRELAYIHYNKRIKFSP
jgi:hypothetical protein